MSIAFNPFTWGNQACWLAFFACLVAQVWLLGWAVVTRPLHDAHALNKVGRKGGMEREGVDRP